MGRRQTTAGADDHFKDSKEHEHDKNGELQIVVVSSCKYCGTGWRRLSGPRKVAHLCGIPGENIVHCEQRQDIPAKVVEDLLWTTKKGRLELEARELAKKKIAGQQAARKPVEPAKPGASRTIEEVRKKLHRLLRPSLSSRRF